MFHEYRGGCLEYHGVFSTVGDILSTVGGYLEYRGGCSVPWGYHDTHEGYHEYRRGCSVLWGESFVICTLYNVCSVDRGMFSTLGVFSTSGDTMSASGGYHEYIREIS